MLFKSYLLAIMAMVDALDPARPRAEVTEGQLIGDSNNGVAIFCGILFAAPPVGAGRWAPPQPPQTWSTTHSRPNDI